MHASLCAFSIVSVLCPWFPNVLPAVSAGTGNCLGHSDSIQRHEPISPTR
ncbi:hypothetical protein CLIM01_08405 [Colletotrichum limetticola]|uniref:Uncharacterized protein n=1 Tax=Colletotrichum limetticola TaxID=1209924 RepID=A0ABQ9PRQ8_9PEZI|nr:hypothetical protein CLIM01_08405 [Colletotrichum limetticola]